MKLIGGLLAVALLAGCTSSSKTIESSPTVSPTSTSTPPASPTSASAEATSQPVAAVAADTKQHTAVLAAKLLTKVAIEGRAPKTGYTRGRFGAAWSDDTTNPSGHNGCDTRTICIRSLPGATLPQ
jgi:hypothetical protein